MRDDQFDRLETLQEKLCEIVLEEADPDNWPGTGTLPKNLTKDERGDRYWCKKNAAATFTLLNKTLSLAHFRTTPKNNGDPDEPRSEEETLDQEIANAEKQAVKHLENFQKRYGPEKLRLVK
jgi:hypothetical protein